MWYIRSTTSVQRSHEDILDVITKQWSHQSLDNGLYRCCPRSRLYDNYGMRFDHASTQTCLSAPLAYRTLHADMPFKICGSMVNTKALIFPGRHTKCHMRISRHWTSAVSHTRTLCPCWLHHSHVLSWSTRSNHWPCISSNPASRSFWPACCHLVECCLIYGGS